jgi:aminoglycoside phosphotransferase (APT) family kinase protein
VETQDLSLPDATDLLRRSGYEPRQIQPAGSGSHHHHFVVEIDDGPMQLLRLPRYAHSHRSIRTLLRETEALRRVRPFIPVPHPIVLLPGEEQPEGSLMPILPGTRATEVVRDRPDGPTALEIARQLGLLLADLHRVRRDADERTHLAPLFEDQERENALLHGDAHFGNILVDENGSGRWRITGLVDWSFSAWGPPEADLVEMAICEAEPRPHVGRAFYEAYLNAGGLPPREAVFRRSLVRELERRLQYHSQSHDPLARNAWTHWLTNLRRNDAVSTRVFDAGRAPGRGLA